MGNDQRKNRSKSTPNTRSRLDSSRSAPDPIEISDDTVITPLSKNGNCSKNRGRHESTDTDASDISATLERAPPDGGWGWVVVGAAFLVNLIADGVTFSFGVFYVEFNKYFKEVSKSKTAWIGSLLASMPLLSGPIASSLADRFGCRRVTIAGSLLATLGFVLSSQAESVEMLYVTFGIITGFGLSLCYVAAVVIVAYYFDRRRSLATGLSVCGGGIGTFIFAPLTAELINLYGWQGTTLLLAGAFLHLCICGALMRDLEWTRKKVHKRPTSSVDLLPSEISTLKKERLCSSAICIPTFVKEQGDGNYLDRPQFRTGNFKSMYCAKNSATDKTNCGPRSCPPSDNCVNAPISKLTNGDVFHDISKETGPPITPNSNKKPPRNNVLEVSEGADSSATNENDKNFNIIPINVVKDDGLHDMEAGVELIPETANRDSVTNLTTIVNSNGPSPLPTQQVNSLQRYLLDNTGTSWTAIHRHSLTYRGAILSLKRYRLRPASSCPDIISVATVDDRSTHEWKAVMGDVCKWMQGVWEYEHLSNSRFVLFVLSNLLLYMWYDVPYVYLQDAALQSNYSEDKSSYLISIVGFFNMIGNIILGYVGDKPWADSIVVYGVCMALCGASMMMIPWFMAWNYISLASGCGVFGLTIAANYSLTSVILVKVVSLEKFANAYGLLLLVQGIGNLIGPPIAGVIYDLTGTNTWSFLVAGGGVLASSVFILAPRFCSKRNGM